MRRAIVVLFGVAFLTGCGNKQDANEKNFGAAIGQYLDKKGELCLDFKKWPVDVSEMDLRMQKIIPTGKVEQMEALAAVGLVSGVDAEVEERRFGGAGQPTGRKFKVKRYTLTDAAKPFEKQTENEYVGINGKVKETLTNLCYGKKALDKVVKWEGPMKFGDYQGASVKYLYKVDGVASWAKNPEFLAAFPYVRQVIEAAGKKEQTHGVTLTNIGWEANGLDS